jgi:hypothetical protein
LDPISADFAASQITPDSRQSLSRQNVTTESTPCGENRLRISVSSASPAGESANSAPSARVRDSDLRKLTEFSKSATIQLPYYHILPSSPSKPRA